jgi:hypothetical protein
VLRDFHVALVLQNQSWIIDIRELSQKFDPVTAEVVARGNSTPRPVRSRIVQNDRDDVARTGIALRWRLGGAVFSHWVLDMLVHRPDMPLYDNSAKIGLGLWNLPRFAFVL